MLSVRGNQGDLMMRWRVAGAAAIAIFAGLTTGRAQAVGFQPVSCKGFAVTYNGTADKKDCCEAELEATRAKRLVVRAPTFVLLATYYDSGLRHYFTPEPLDKLAAESGLFASPQKVSNGSGGNGYTVAVFVGDLPDRTGKAVCALFSKYYGKADGQVAGRAELPNGAGYKFMVQGFCCPYGRKELKWK